MRLADCTTFVVGNPPPHFGGRYFIFVKLVTSCGVVGYGEIYAASFSPHLTASLAEDMFSRYLEGADPHQIELFVRRAYGSGFTHRPDATVAGIISGLEMACMDIIGKAHDMPCYDLIGGRVQDRLRCYTYLYPAESQDAASFYADSQASAERAAQKVAEGFTAVKFDPAGPYTICDGRQPDQASLHRSRDFCRDIRQAVGDKADLLFGTHGQFTPAGAIRLARYLEEFDPLWFEEPVPPDNPEAMAQVARSTSIPVATGERLCMAVEFQAILDAGAASILQPDLGRAGGIREGYKIGMMAGLRQVSVAPHLYCGPLVAAANIQLATALPNFLILEVIEQMNGFHRQLVTSDFEFDAGYIIPPTGAGLGFELNEEVASAHPYSGDKLHLEMQNRPFDARTDQYFAGG